MLVDHHTFTVDEYHRMIETGILTEDDRVELINGEIIAMSPINSPHNGRVIRINALFSNLLGQRAVIGVQGPLQIPSISEPEPDIMLLKPRHDFYSDSHPQPKDVYLLIEVADSSLTIDRQIKLPLYATANVPEVWIVNVADQQVEIYRTPVDGQYQGQQVARQKQEITVPFFLFKVTAEDLLGT